MNKKPKKKERPVVLVADDESDARSTVIDFLKERYECVFKEAKDGEEAISFIKNNPCDIVILDIKMPKQSGMRVLDEIKAFNSEIDVLIISAWASDNLEEEAAESGATDFAAKPLDLKTLALKFANILDMRGQK